VVEARVNRVGELWEHNDLRYYVLERAEGGGWHAIRLGEVYWNEPLFTVLADEFFDQEWWERIA
jgi:hypothetical protein